MKISNFNPNTTGDAINAKGIPVKTEDDYKLSVKDEISIGKEDTRSEEGWELSSRLQQFAEEQKQENIALKQEVERLKKELEGEKKKSQEKHVEMDLEEGKFTLKDIKYKGLNVEKIVFTNPKVKEQIEELSSGDIFSKKPEEFRDDFFDILRGPFTVEEGRIKFSERTLTELLNSTKDFEKHKIRNLEAKYEDGKCRVNGDYGNLIPIPFTLDYELGFKNNRLNIKMDKIKVAGFLPVPGIIQDIMVDVFAGSFDKGIVQYDKNQGNTFFINVGAMLPIGLRADFTKIQAEKGILTIDMGPPEENKK